MEFNPIIYAVLPAYENDNIYYQVLPYSLKGVIRDHFKYFQGFKSLIPFLRKCRLSENKARQLAELKILTHRELIKEENIKQQF